MRNRFLEICIVVVLCLNTVYAFSSDVLEEAKSLANSGDYKKAYEKALAVIDEMDKEIKNKEGLVKYYKDELARLAKPLPIADRAYNEAANTLWASAWDLQHDGVFKKVGKEKQEYLERAVKTYRRIIIDYPLSNKAEEAQYRIGRIYYKFLKDDKKAEEEFQKYLDSYPNGMFASDVRDVLLRLTKE